MTLGGYGDYPHIRSWPDHNAYMIRWGDGRGEVTYNIPLQQAIELAYNNIYEWDLSLEKCLAIIKLRNEHCGGKT